MPQENTSLVLSEKLINEFLKDLSFFEKKSAATIKNYQHVLTLYLKEQGTLEASFLKSFIRKHSARVSPTTQALWISALQKFINWASKKNLCHKKIGQTLVRPKLKKKLTQVINGDDLPLLLNYIKKQSEAEQVVFELLYGQGLRISEVISLNEESLHYGSQHLKIIGKGRKVRSLPLTPKLKVLLRPQSKSARSYWSAPPTENTIRAWMDKWGKECGLEEKYGKLHPHKLRHTIATHLLRNGAKLPHVQKFLGHKNLSTTERYTHVDIDDLIRVYDQSLPDKLK